MISTKHALLSLGALVLSYSGCTRRSGAPTDAGNQHPDTGLSGDSELSIDRPTAFALEVGTGTDQMIPDSGPSDSPIKDAEGTSQDDTGQAQVDSRSCGAPGELIYASVDLAGHDKDLEVLPTASPACIDQASAGADDVDLVLHAGSYGSVTCNASARNIYGNAIVFKKFMDHFPDGKAVDACSYFYRCRFRLPSPVVADASQKLNPQSIHCMVQYMDPLPTPRESVEATVYIAVNAWEVAASGGRVAVKLYAGDDQGSCSGSGKLWLCNTTAALSLDQEWHEVEMALDLRGERYLSLSVDGSAVPGIDGWRLARVSRPSYADKFLSITTEVGSAAPNTSCDYRYTAEFTDLQLAYR